MESVADTARLSEILNTDKGDIILAIDKLSLLEDPGTH